MALGAWFVCLVIKLKFGKRFGLRKFVKVSVITAILLAVITCEVSAVGVEDLPDVYSSVEKGFVTVPKDQEQNGSCWAFATVSMAESSLISTGGTFGGGRVATADSLDLSEAQLLYFSSHEGFDPLRNLGKDRYYYDDASAWLTTGGSARRAALALAAWRGLTEEYCMPYINISSDVVYNPEFSIQSVAKLDRAYWFDMSDVYTVKKFVMEYGSVVSSYMYDDKYCVRDLGTYYCPFDADADHAITIVGWDDNYSKYNFEYFPDGDGAWLVKNSWGTEWGDGGYGWISYYDTTLNNSDATCMVFVDSTKYDNNYQCDGTVSMSGISVSPGTILANTFVAAANEYERLDAVSFGILSPNVSYSIDIYKGEVTNGHLSGPKLLSESIVGSFDLPGFYTVEFPEDVFLKRGETFTVAIKVSGSSEDDKIGFMVDEDEVCEGSGLKSDNDLSKDKSYYGTNIFYMYDLVEKNSATARIKALTCNVDATVIPEGYFDIEESTDALTDNEDSSPGDLNLRDIVTSPTTIGVLFVVLVIYTFVAFGKRKD